MSQEITWTVTEPTGKVTTTISDTDKLPHYIEVKILKSMDDNTKAWYEKFNNMRNKLLEHGLMEQR
jgi:hypothetical protein